MDARYGESIYGTRGGPFDPVEDAAGTLCGATTAVTPSISRAALAGRRAGLPALPGKVASARVLGHDGAAVAVRQSAGAVAVSLPDAPASPWTRSSSWNWNRPV